VLKKTRLRKKVWWSKRNHY